MMFLFLCIFCIYDQIDILPKNLGSTVDIMEGRVLNWIKSGFLKFFVKQTSTKNADIAM